MIRFMFAVFVSLHGFVHLLYMGHSQRIFRLQDNLHWPDGSWMFSDLLGFGKVRTLASISLTLAAAGFTVGAVSLLLQRSWWKIPTVSSSILSALVFILLWDGSLHQLNDKGLLGVLIDFTIITVVLIFQHALT